MLRRRSRRMSREAGEEVPLNERSSTASYASVDQRPREEEEEEKEDNNSVNQTLQQPKEEDNHPADTDSLGARPKEKNGAWKDAPLRPEDDPHHEVDPIEIYRALVCLLLKQRIIDIVS